MIGGSMASGIHGIYRTSLDAALVADRSDALSRNWAASSMRTPA
jgi:hypothetical protein